MEKEYREKMNREKQRYILKNQGKRQKINTCNLKKKWEHDK